MRHHLSSGFAAVLLAAMPAVAQDNVSKSSDWHFASCLLRSTSMEMSSSTIENLIQSDLFLAAVHPRAVTGRAHQKWLEARLQRATWPPTRDPEAASPDTGLIFVFPRKVTQPSPNFSIVGYVVAANDRSTSVEVSQAIFATLKRLAPDTSAELRQELPVLEERAVRARAMWEEGRAELTRALEESRGVDPHSWLEFFEPQVMNREQELLSFETSVAMSHASRDHLASRLQQLESLIQGPGEQVPNPAYLDLREELAIRRADLKSLQRRKEPGEEGARREWLEAVANQDRLVEEVESKLRLSSQYIDGPPTSQPNPEYVQLERRVLQEEEQLNSSEARLKAMRSAVERLRDQVVQMRAMASISQRLEQLVNQRAAELSNAERDLEKLEARIRSVRSAEQTLQMVSGPTVLEGR